MRPNTSHGAAVHLAVCADDVLSQGRGQSGGPHGCVGVVLHDAGALGRIHAQGSPHAVAAPQLRVSRSANDCMPVICVAGDTG